MSEKLVFVHIPKTGGTSVTSSIVQFYGAKHVWRYNPLQGALYPASRRILRNEDPMHTRLDNLVHRKFPRLRKTAAHIVNIAYKASQPGIPDVFDRAEAITGHFPASLFIEEVKNYGYTLITTVRDPLQRTISAYRYGVSRGKSLPTLEEYVHSTENQNVMSTYLDVPLSTIDVIGSTANLGAFLQQVGVLTESPVPHANRTEEVGSITIPDSLVQEFTELNRQDYELYESARSRVVAL